MRRYTRASYPLHRPGFDGASSLTPSLWSSYIPCIHQGHPPTTNAAASATVRIASHRYTTRLIFGLLHKSRLLTTMENVQRSTIAASLQHCLGSRSHQVITLGLSLICALPSTKDASPHTKIVVTFCWGGRFTFTGVHCWVLSCSYRRRGRRGGLQLWWLCGIGRFELVWGHWSNLCRLLVLTGADVKFILNIRRHKVHLWDQTRY